MSALKRLTDRRVVARWRPSWAQLGFGNVLCLIALVATIVPHGAMPQWTSAQEATSPAVVVSGEATPTPEATTVAVTPEVDPDATPVPESDVPTPEVVAEGSPVAESLPPVPDDPVVIEEPSSGGVAIGTGRIANADGDDVRLRAEPSYEGDVLLMVPEGTEVDIQDGPTTAADGSQWWFVAALDMTGYIVEDYLQSVPADVELETGAMRGSISEAALDCDPGQDKDLSDCSFDGQALEGVDFSRSILVRAAFVDADLTNATFSGADLTDATLTGATLEGAIFAGATFSTGTIWGTDTICPDGTISGGNGSTCVNNRIDGALTISVPLAGDFSIRSITGSAQTVTATLDAFTVRDLRGASAAGWHVTAQATEVVGEDPAHTLASGSLTMSPPSVTPNGTSSPGPSVAVTPFAIDSGVVSFASAGVEAGAGIFEFGATTLTLAIPADVYADTYTSKVTISIVSGP